MFEFNSEKVSDQLCEELQNAYADISQKLTECPCGTEDHLKVVVELRCKYGVNSILLSMLQSFPSLCLYSHHLCHGGEEFRKIDTFHSEIDFIVLTPKGIEAATLQPQKIVKRTKQGNGGDVYRTILRYLIQYISHCKEIPKEHIVYVDLDVVMTKIQAIDIGHNVSLRVAMNVSLVSTKDPHFKQFLLRLHQERVVAAGLMMLAPPPPFCNSII